MLRFIKDHNQKGQQAEQLALSFLQQNGLEIVQTNFSCKLGEIDLIMLDQDTLVFVEVKYRKQKRYGHPLETINPSKQRKIIKTIQYFLMKYPKFAQYPCRIDAIAIHSQVQSQQETLEWIKNAFHA